MAQVHPEISPSLRAFIEAQPMFFVGSAPLSAEGHINVSPKGLDSFRVLSPNEVVYLDVTGSGNETSAHLEENGRITLMFCAFTGAPNILRLYGKGRTVLANSDEGRQLGTHFPAIVGVRQFIVATIDRVQTSCGFGVPKMDFVAQRDTLPKWSESKGEAGLHEYWQQKNMISIDNLPSTLHLEQHS